MPVLVHRGDSSILTTRVHFPSGSSPHLWTVRKGQALKPLELLSYFLDVSSWDLVPVEGVHSLQSYFFEQIQTKRKSNWTKYCPVVLPVCGIGRGYTGKFRLSEYFLSGPKNLCNNINYNISENEACKRICRPLQVGFLTKSPQKGLKKQSPARVVFEIEVNNIYKI